MEKEKIKENSATDSQKRSWYNDPNNEYYNSTIKNSVRKIRERIDSASRILIKMENGSKINLEPSEGQPHLAGYPIPPPPPQAYLYPPPDLNLPPPHILCELLREALEEQNRAIKELVTIFFQINDKSENIK